VRLDNNLEAEKTGDKLNNMVAQLIIVFTSSQAAHVISEFVDRSGRKLAEDGNTLSTADKSYQLEQQVTAVLEVKKQTLSLGRGKDGVANAVAVPPSNLDDESKLAHTLFV